MKYLEDTLAEQCLSKTLYPNTKIHVRRKKVEGTLMTYTNELEVEIDFSDVDSNLLDVSTNENDSSTSSQNKSEIVSISTEDINSTSSDEETFEDSNLNEDELKPTIAGRAARFFRKKNL